jgi:hypothetical protein
VTPARALREQLRVPKDQLAARLGIDTYGYSRIENGSVPALRANAAKLGLLLAADPRELPPLRKCLCGCGTVVTRTWARGHSPQAAESVRRTVEKRRLQQGIPIEKICERCGHSYTRRRGENTKKWLKRRWCSASCWRDSPLCRTPPHLRRWL